jgi:PAS domain S-box-containing protein
MAAERGAKTSAGAAKGLGTQDILAALPMAVYTTDAEGRITSYNDAAAALWGRRPVIGEDRWCAGARLFGADGKPMPHDESPLAQTLRQGDPVRGAEMILERPDGTRLLVLPHPTAIKDSTGRVIGGVNMLIDASDRRAMHHANARLAAIIESSDDAIISKTLGGIITSWNKGAERLFGYTAGEAIGQSVLMLIPDDRHDEEPGIIARIRRGERIDHYETRRRRKDGTLIDLSLTVSPVKNEKGEVVGASKIARDITDRKRAEQQRELLLNEIKHRVKNTLGTVQAIASQTFRQAPREERDIFGARIRSLASAHDLLTHQDREKVEMADVAERALRPFREVGRDRFETGGPAVSLVPGKALLLAMALHELSTNAVKYGALSAPDGKVHLDWQTQGPRLILTWRETGGPEIAPPSHRGFGTTLIERAFKGEQGQTHFDYRPEGLVCTLEMLA